jgi:methionine-S-sulfoxide reductase
MEGIFEAQPGVSEAISGYAEGDGSDANYDAVSSGNTKHREAVKVVYDPSIISLATLVDLYFTQIDPTQVDGQFADIGFRYTTAIYYQNDDEKEVIESAKNVLESSKKYDKPIAVQVVPFTTFFPAEEYHQDYYKKSAFRYNLYKKGSGRAGFIEKNGTVGATLGSYRDYDETILPALKDKKILLFFHADWCSTCKSFEKQISETTLPTDVIILKIDFDTATDLKKQYSILSQSTWVQIGVDGKAYKRWLGKSNLEDILSDTLSPKEILSEKLTPLQYEVTQM